MGHGKEDLDVMVGLEAHWHGLNKIVKEITFANSGQTFAIQPVALGDYRFLEPLKKAVEKKDWDKVASLVTGLAPLDGWKAFETSDNGHVVHVARDSWTPIQPERVWGIIGNSLQNVPHRVVSAGTYGNRAKLYVSVEILKTDEFSISGQKYHNFINLLMGNDGSMGLTVHDNSFKVVCKNTFNASLAAGHNFNVSIQHTLNAEQKIQGLEKTLELVLADRQVIYQKLGELEATPCDWDSRGVKIITGFLMDTVKAPSTRTKNQVERIGQLFGDARRGNFASTMRHLFDAGTDYYTHESSGGDNKWKQVESSEVGAARLAKVDLFKALTIPELLTETEARGEKCLIAAAPVTVAVGAVEDTANATELLTGKAETPAPEAPAPKAPKAPKSKAPAAPKLPKSKRN